MRSIRPTLEPLEKRYALAASLSVTGPRDPVFEGESLEFTLRLSEASRQVETVFVSTADGTATYGSDYFAMASQQIQFSPGQTMKTVTVRSLRDSGTPRAEGVETFSVIARPANAALGTARAIGRIADYTPPPRISVGDVSLNEGNSGRSDATFTITLSAASVKTVTVAYATADLSATLADSDYVAASGTLTFAPGETRKTVNVGINGDRKLESNETFSFTLSAPTNADLGQSRAFATIVNDEVDLPGFQITLNFIDSPAGPVPQAIRSLSQQAVSRWSRVIIGDLPGVLNGGVFIDDLEMSVQMGLLGGAPNGPTGPLANARPVDFRPGSNGLPYTGITGLNPFYSTLNTPADRDYLLDTITHEIGHALGFAPGADFYDRYVVGNNFTGPNALREYNTLFGISAVGVPLQPGSLAHWSEAIFDEELMTPTAEPVGVREFISTVTIGALQDMGYSVNYGAAEPYVRPSSLSQQAAAAAAVASSSTPTAVTPQTVAKPSRPAVQPSTPARPAAPDVATPRPAITPAARPAAPVRAPVVTTPPRPSISISTSGIRRF
jgi:hypothetical protein